MKKEQIIQESLKLFMQYGIRSVSMDDVCRRLGISKKTLYTYVESKGDLVRMVVNAHQADECAIMEKIMEEAEDALIAMVNIGHYIVGLLKKMKPGVIYDLQKYYRNIYESWDADHAKQIHDQLVKNLNLGITQGIYRPDIDVEIIARLYVGKARLTMDEKEFPITEFKQEEVARQHFIYHLYGILTQAGLDAMYEQDLLNLKLNS